MLKSLDKAASDLRQKLGESIGSVQKFTTPLQQATTSSLEALQAFTLGQAEHQKLDDEGAIPHLKRAIELDPNFAMAYATLGVVYGNPSPAKLQRENLNKAFDLKDRASEREKFYISAHYYSEGTGDLDKSIAIYEQWKQTYPRDSVPWDNLASCTQGRDSMRKRWPMPVRPCASTRKTAMRIRTLPALTSIWAGTTKPGPFWSSRRPRS